MTSSPSTERRAVPNAMSTPRPASLIATPSPYDLTRRLGRDIAVYTDEMGRVLMTERPVVVPRKQQAYSDQVPQDYVPEKRDEAIQTHEEENEAVHTVADDAVRAPNAPLQPVLVDDRQGGRGSSTGFLSKKPGLQVQANEGALATQSASDRSVRDQASEVRRQAWDEQVAPGPSNMHASKIEQRTRPTPRAVREDVYLPPQEVSIVRFASPHLDCWIVLSHIFRELSVQLQAWPSIVNLDVEPPSTISVSLI